jgi:CheY-like chemotaxis protein
MFMLDLLTDEGYAVVAVANGQEALAFLPGMHQPPALILLDLNMPLMDAWEFRAIQQIDPRFAAIPVVLFSTAPNLAEQARELGAVEAIPKTSDIDSILSVMAQYCAPDPE